MAAKVYPCGEWTPDLAGNVLVTAKNVTAIANGYAPAKSFSAVTSQLGGPFNGGGAFLDSTGVPTLLAATDFAVYKYSQVGDFTGSTWSALTISAALGHVIRYAQFGDNVVVANGGTIASYDLLTGVVTFDAGWPSAIDAAQVRDFVMLITTDNSVQWSEFNDSSSWTIGTNQAGKQPSLWGQLRRIVGGEYGILLTDRAVVRATYVGVEGGLDIIWQFDEIAAEVGCMAAGSVCNVGRLIFFLSERGFEMCDGSTVTTIGDSKFNKWFFDRFSREDVEHIWSAVDPRNSVVLWALPGTPGTVIVYNWVLNRATTFEMDVTGLMTGYNNGVTLEELDAIYGDLDSVPISFDSPTLQGGGGILLVADGTNTLGALTGPNMEATLTLKDVEPTAGRRSRVREARLASDATDASVTIDARMRAGDSEFVRSSATMRSNGKMPIRANGRFNTVEVTIPEGADWTYIRGIELEFEPGDGR